MKLRGIYLFALFALPAWPNACTLSTSYNLSASGGHWTGTGCTGGSYIPGNGDTVTLADGVTLTQDQNWTIGASGANDTTPAISSGNSGQVIVQSGKTLTLRGDALSQYDGGGTPYLFLTFQAGSSLVFDSSLSASPTTTRYRVGSNGNWNYRSLAFNGTASFHVTVTSVTTGGALAGIIKPGSTVVGNGGAGVANLVGSYVDLSYLGDASQPAIVIGVSGYTAAISLQHFTCNYCGQIYINSFDTVGSILFSYGVFTNALGLSDIGLVNLFGPITFQHLSLSTIWNQVSSGCSGGGALSGTLTFTDIYFGGAACSEVGTWNDVFYHNINPPSNSVTVMDGNVAGEYYLWDYTNGGEGHLTQPDNGNSRTYSNIMFDVPDDTAGQNSYMFLPITSGSSVVTHAYSNNILLPTKTGGNNGALHTCSNVSGNNETINLVHNTWVGPSMGGVGMLEMDEGGACATPINELYDTLMWATSPSAAWSKSGEWWPTTPSTNPITSILNNVMDTSAHLTATNPSCTTCTNQANGYANKWTATPGTSDFIAPPYFADTTRNVATFDTAYLHNAAGAQWVTGTGYTVGQIVSDPKAGVYANATVNYICTVAHTSGSTTEPNVGASWRSDWQFASLTDIAVATGAGTVITDGAIGCAAGCSMIQTLEGWVKRGFTPQNPALWCSGHDGEAVGAVPFCANGRLTLGMLGSIAGM